MYCGAHVLLHPSWCEGFGNPVAEAMACGCPVITSTRSAMPEVAGGAALLVDPADCAHIARAVQRVGRSGAARGDVASRYCPRENAQMGRFRGRQYRHLSRAHRVQVTPGTGDCARGSMVDPNHHNRQHHQFKQRNSKRHARNHRRPDHQRTVIGRERAGALDRRQNLALDRGLGGGQGLRIKRGQSCIDPRTAT